MPFSEGIMKKKSVSPHAASLLCSDDKGRTPPAEGIPLANYSKKCLFVSRKTIRKWCVDSNNEVMIAHHYMRRKLEVSKHWELRAH